MERSIFVRTISVVGMVLLLLAATACGRSKTNGAGSSAAQSLKTSSSVAAVPLSDAGRVDATLPNPFSVSQASGAGKAATYTVYSNKAFDTHAYLQLSYDASRMTPASVTYGGALGDASKVLFLAVTTKPGMIPIGIWKLSGTPATSDAKQPIATVTFVPAPFAAAGKTVSSTPMGTANEVSDLHVANTGGTNYHATWTEKLQGDYNVDGDVSIADLAPVAQYYGQTVAGATDPAILADGDASGEVSIGDLQPIVVDYSAHNEGYIVQRSDDGGTTWVPDLTGIGMMSPNFVARPMAHLAYAHPQYAFDDTTSAASPQWRVVAFGDGATGAMSPAVGPGAPPDTTPPVWGTTVGIQSAVQNPTNPSTQVDVTFGSATDAQTPPVSYIVSYVQGPTSNFSNPANIHAQVSSPSGAPPFTATVGGLTPSTLYNFRVNVADSATTPNADTNTITLPATTAAPPNAPPVITQQIQGSPVSPVNTGQDVTFTIIATDNEPTDTLVFTWDDGDATNGTFSSQSESGTNPGGVTSTIHWQSATAKTFSITCSISDGVNTPVDATPYSMTVNTPPPPVSFATDIQPIYSARCTVCHSGPSPTGSLNLSQGLAYGNTVNVVSGESPPEVYVKPGDPANSFLWFKVSNNFMPLTGGPLTSAQKTLIQNWILQGALNN